MAYLFAKNMKTNFTVLSIVSGAICGVGIYLIFAINDAAFEMADLNEGSDNYIHFNLTKSGGTAAEIAMANLENSQPERAGFDPAIELEQSQIQALSGAAAEIYTSYCDNDSDCGAAICGGCVNARRQEARGEFENTDCGNNVAPAEGCECEENRCVAK